MKYLAAAALTILLLPIWIIWWLFDTATGETALKDLMKELWK